MERSEIVLIGPVRTGKSTLGRLLAERLVVSQVSLDEVRLKYYKEIGYDEQLAGEIRQNGGFLAFMYYRELFSAHAAERMLSDYHDCVFDFGAGIYESDEMFQRVHKALSGFPHVILVLPSPDIERSLRILTERDSHPPIDLNFDINRHFLEHHTYYDLAKFVVYTEGKTPEETCQEILSLIREV